MIREERDRTAAHEEAVRRYGPVLDYTSLPYEQVIAFERGAIWQRQRESDLKGIRPVTRKTWVLTADAMDYDDRDRTLGVFGSLPEAQAALTEYIRDAMERHPSNRALLNDSYTATLWAGTEEIESWTKDGDAQWTPISPRGSDQ